MHSHTWIFIYRQRKNLEICKALKLEYSKVIKNKEASTHATQRSITDL